MQACCHLASPFRGFTQRTRFVLRATNTYTPLALTDQRAPAGPRVDYALQRVHPRSPESVQAEDDNADEILVDSHRTTLEKTEGLVVDVDLGFEKVRQLCSENNGIEAPGDQATKKPLSA